MVSQISNGMGDPSVIPVKLWECFDDWLEGKSIDQIADKLNITMREMDQILRQLVVEKLSHAQKKNHKRREKKISKGY